jgi:hypothetical protein
LLGSIPFGLLLTRLAGKGDIREDRLGQYRRDQRAADRAKGLAAATLLLDAAKGAAAVLLAQRCVARASQFAARALIGHLYPVWLRFKGGKGVATLLGILGSAAVAASRRWSMRPSGSAAARRPHLVGRRHGGGGQRAGHRRRARRRDLALPMLLGLRPARHLEASREYPPPGRRRPSRASGTAKPERAT